MNRNIKIRILQYIFFLISILGIIMLPVQWTLLGIFAYGLYEVFGGNIGLHRYFCHKSFKTNKIWHNIMLFMSHYIGVGTVVTWVGQHRHHHKFSDTDNDVHNFRKLGIMKILFGVWEVNIERKMVKDVIRDKALMWWHNNYWNFHALIFLTWIMIDYTFGTYLTFSLYAFPNLLCLISGYVLAIVTHSHGYKTYDAAESTNSWIANIYTLGEGWHNNHHANSNNVRQGELWWEWDLPAFIIERFMDVDRIKKSFN